ncbi:GIY-YIG nuclease family protein [Streptomyces sp. NPDC007148]|uniref:GIY-YIG nuclease family protein n=1 Tax=Streptomyces sp. NPDC007148 TaxID=3364775 RepID=UPI0036957D6D
MKTRTVRRSRRVPHTIDGITHIVDEEYDEVVPIPPRDWDHIVLVAVTFLAGLLVAVTVVWSTTNIGGLLDRVTIAPAAYAAAVAFDLAWIMCMAVEWLARYDRRRAKVPRIAGHVALAIAMAAVATHGWLDGERAIGLIGASVSGLVKGLWTVVLGYYAAPLDARSQAWVEKQLAEVGAQQALIPVQRQLMRSRGAIEAEALSLTATPRGQLAPEPDDELPATRSAKELRGPAGTPVEDLSSLRGMHGPIVYFIANGGRIKIGTTRDLMRRLSALCLRFDNLLCAFHGSHDIERRFHKLFEPYRVGNSEWFEIEGSLAEFVAQYAPVSDDEGDASSDAQPDADDASQDAPEASAPTASLPPLPEGGSKASLILAASSMMRPDAPAAEIAHLLAQHGHAVDTAYIRTVLSRRKQEDEEVGKGGGGYA